MQETAFSPLKSLDCLCRIFPVKGAIVVGTGMGNGPWFDLLLQQAVDDVLLIEADKDNVKYLEKKYSSRNQWKVLHQVVSDQEEESLFYRLSNKAESSLVHPDLLKALWPNISTKEELSCSTVTLDGLAQEKGYKANWLVIDCLPAISMLNGAENNLSAFDVVVVRIVLGNDGTSQLFDVREDIDAMMQKQGLVSFGIEPELHPSLGHAVYIRDIPHQTVELKRLITELEQLREACLEQQTAWDQEKKELQHELNECKKSQREFTERFQKNTKQTESLLHEQKQVWMQELLAKHEKSLLERIEKQEAGFNHTRELIISTFSKELIKATNHIESFWSAEHYFATGKTPTLPTELTKWPISPDMAMLLINLIESNTYDLVIEFGSGFSTVVIAKALIQQASRQNKTPAKFVSFEHLDNYYKKTVSQLENAGLDHAVQLELTPLSPYTAPDNNIYSYYDCRAILKKLGQMFEGSHILVFVDGPPASTGKHARYPALQHMLTYFNGLRIDMLLDDTIRTDEQEIVKRWQDDLQRKEKNCVATKFNLEKEAILLQMGF